MATKSDNFTTIIKAHIDKYASQLQYSEEGTVLSVSDGIVMVTGLKNVMLNEMLKFANGAYGIALNLETDYVGAVMFKEQINFYLLVLETDYLVELLIH